MKKSQIYSLLSVKKKQKVTSLSNMIRLNFCFIVLLSICRFCGSEPRIKAIADEDIEMFAELSDVVHFNKTLDKILIPRVVGTPTHAKVKKFLIKELKDLGMHVETDKFQDKTPFGVLEFENIIAKFNPKASRYVTLTAHFDSKYFSDDDFYGAIDSAVPCAMMLNLVKILKPHLSEYSSVSLMLIFFDGEEAFVEWSSTDSLYGARHLAAEWEKTGELDSIDIFILLDILGAPNPKFYSFFEETESWYFRLVSIEEKLASFGLLQACTRCRKDRQYFQPKSKESGIEDDHIPFLQRDVPILHLIASPFPKVWHTPADDITALDINTIENLNKILRVFIIEYLDNM